MRHLDKMILTLHHTKFLLNGGFFKYRDAGSEEELFAIEQEDDEFAVLTAAYSSAMLAARVRRLMYCWKGWPHAMQKVHSTPAKAVSVIAEFRAHRDQYKRLGELEGKPMLLEKMLERSTFNTTRVRQLSAILDSSDWEMTPRFGAMTVGLALAGTVPTEETIGVAKNNFRLVGAKRVEKPGCSGPWSTQRS